MQSLWNRKAMKVNATECVIHTEEEQADLLWNDQKCQRVCEEILKSSTKTNQFVDDITRANPEDGDKLEHGEL